MNPRITFLCGLALAASALVAWPAHARDGYVDLERRLTPEQLRATGLDRLTAAELELLNRLLREEHTGAARSAAANIGLRPSREAEAPTGVESALVGEFRGWTPGAVLNLENGQQWRVIEGELHTRRVTSPKVTIEPGFMGAWYLKVEGQTPRAKVRRVK